MTNRSHIVLSTACFEPRWLERLHNLSPDLRIEQRPTSNAQSIPDEVWQEVEVLYTYATLPSPEQAPRLRWVQLHSSGVNQILDHPLFHTPVLFTTASGIHAVTIAEHVFAVVLAWFHRFPRALEWQQRGQWPPEQERFPLFVSEELWRKTIGIVGYGTIGRQVARLAKAFGMQVLAMHRTADHRDRGYVFPGVGDPDGMLPDSYYRPDQINSMLGESDIVVIAVPSTSKTRGMFGDAAFRAMKPTAFLVNIARGDICNEAALVRALRERWIAGAALDVFHQEPLPDDHPLWHLPNVLISPHVAGFTTHYDERAAMIFEENLRRYLTREPLYNLIDKEEGY
jgi:phosphoglycerate dehydrogenase-like enzyme